MSGQGYIRRLARRCLVHCECAPDVAALIGPVCHGCGGAWGSQEVVGGAVASMIHYCTSPFDLEPGEGAP